MENEQLLYRPAEAAKLLAVSRARLYQLLARNELGSIKLGASRRIPAEELNAFVARLREALPPDEADAEVKAAGTSATPKTSRR